MQVDETGWTISLVATLDRELVVRRVGPFFSKTLPFFSMTLPPLMHAGTGTPGC